MIAVLQDVGFALQGDAPLVDKQHLIGDELGIFRIVGDHQHGNALLAGEAGHFGQHLPAQGGIEGREGFIQQQQWFASHQRASQPDSLLLAAGELFRLAVEHLAKTNPPGCIDHLCPLGGTQAQTRVQADSDIVKNRQVEEEVVILKKGGDRSLGWAQRQQNLRHRN